MLSLFKEINIGVNLEKKDCLKWCRCKRSTTEKADRDILPVNFVSLN